MESMSTTRPYTTHTHTQLINADYLIYYYKFTCVYFFNYIVFF